MKILTERKKAILNHIKTMLREDDALVRKIHDAQVKRDAFDLAAKKYALDKAKETLKQAEEKFKAATDSKQTDTTAEKTAVDSAKKSVKSANDMVIAATQKLEGTKKSQNIIN